ncbi:ribonuclease J [uncultured Ruminococcus sp.]|uniref:ribonuclease J n=1 Tax=uncultured Ruminococcus sp. TaxID=165186 RepID=UPI002931D73D|nr:ribonuclease J [uncultured Ruminococcus sp.]
MSKERNNRNFKLKNTNIGKGQAKSKSAKSSKPKANRRPQRPTKPSVKVSFLGGLNEIGKNITLIECEGDMIIIDCGMAFPDGDMLGVDLVIPDFTYIEQNFDKVKGIVLTHGHEDHIGGLPYLLSRVNIPIYGTPLTLGLVGNKLKEHSLFNKAKLNVVNAGDTIRLGCMEVKFIHVNHSIPDAVAFAIRTPAGTLVHTGDFKIDCTPILGDAIDFSSFAQAGDEGVLALLAESTNASRPGFTRTERLVSDSLNMLFNNAANYRIIIATFASNVNRVQQIIDCAAKYGRKVAFSGRSMVNYMDVAKKLGYLNVPDNILIDLDMLDKYPREQIVLVTTGSQGEPMSALSRMAYSDHRKVVVGEGDFIIISANPIPGNEKTVGNVVDELLKRGCKVIYESMYDVHVSGHACQEELKIIHRLVRPKFFIPVHGEQKHLRKHADLAEFLGMDRKNIFIGDVGSTVEINEDYMKEIAPVPAGKVFVDGLGVGDVGSIVLRDRKHLGQDGLIIIVASLDVYDGHVISGPDVVSRGFVYVRESEQLLEEVRKLALDILEDCADNNIHEWGIIKNRIKDEISKLIAQRTRRAPMILPILQEV